MTTPEQSSPPRWGRQLLLLIALIGAVVGGAYWHEPILRALGRGAPAASEKPSAGQLWTCGMHPQVIQDHPGECPICHMKLTPMVGGAAGGNDSTGAPGSVVIDPVVVQNMGVRTVPVTRGLLARHVRAAGSIVEPETGRTDISLRVSGWIEKLHAGTEGMVVRRGEPLFDLYSPDLRLAIEELIAARRAGGLDSTGAMKGAGEALVGAARRRLQTLGLSADQIERMGALENAPEVVTISSPIDGVVVEKAGVYTGSAVVAGQMVMRLADRSTMWVEARVPEGMLGRVAIGQHAIVRVDALDGRAIGGEVVFVHPNLDEMTRTAIVRMGVPNPDGLLRSGMYGVVEIDAGSSAEVTIVPREAIIDSGESRIVFVSQGHGRFEPRRVTLGERGDGGMVEVESGLAPGEMVVASGQFLLDSESRLREAVAKFLTGATEPPPASAGARREVDASVSSDVIDKVVAEYLGVVEPLGEEKPETPPARVDGLLGAIDALARRAEGADAGRLAAQARDAVGALRGQTTQRQRELLKPASAAIIAIVDAMAPSRALASDLYVAHCPMVDAQWIQRSTTLANPYYAEDMKECGTIERALARPAGATERGAP